MKSKLVQKKRTAGAPFFSSESRFGLRMLFGVANVLCLSLVAVLNVAAQEGSFLPGQTRVVSTAPANGDLNPYGVAFIPPGFPQGLTTGGAQINPGDVLVSNFNASSNLQGTGSTIVDVPPNGPLALFFQYPQNPNKAPVVVGLTTALNILRQGFVLVGNFPSPDNSGSCLTAGTGSIIVIDKNGNLVSEFTDPANKTVQGPWDSALFDRGSTAKYFVANGLSGNIVRYDLAVSAAGVTFNNPTVIATYTQACDAVTFVDSPTGLVYDSHKDVLYVASTADNAVYAVSDAADRNDSVGTGRLVYKDPQHLHGALGLAMAPNGHLLVTNNDTPTPPFNFLDPNQPSELVEFTVEGEFVKQVSIDPTPGGSFGLAVENLGHGTAKLAAVDDSVNLFVIWNLNTGD
jgi:hypothetical protein